MKGVAVVKSIVNSRGGDGVGCFEIKVRTDTKGSSRISNIEKQDLDREEI